MFHDKRIGVVLPAFNAARTLEAVVASIPPQLADEVLLVDDASRDDTVARARSLGIDVIQHATNRGYGANQKTCYSAMLARDVDIITMLHPDGQYPGELLPELVRPIAMGTAEVVLGSRFYGLDPREGGMPTYKFVMNRILTTGQNLAMNTSLSEFHTGFRAFSRRSLERCPYSLNRDDFTFDAELLAQCLVAGLTVHEIASPARYFQEASSIGLVPSIHYGLGVVRTTAAAWAHRHGLRRDPRFD